MSIKMLDGSPATREYLDRVNRAVATAADAQELIDLDELERYAEELRRVELRKDRS